jgi:hypothetical protein
MPVIKATTRENPYIGVYNLITAFGFMNTYHSNQTIQKTAIKLMSPDR